MRSIIFYIQGLSICKNAGYYTALLAILLSSYVARSQNNVDSLKQVIKYSNSNIARASACVQLSEIVYLTNSDSVIPLCSAAIKILDTGKIDTSRESRYMLLNIKAHALNNIGSIFYGKGDLSKALDDYYEGLKLREASGDMMGIAESLNNLGVLYRSQHNLPKAIENYQRSLQLYKMAKKTDGQAVAIGNIGNLYASENDTAKARFYFVMGLELNDSIGDKAGVAKMLNNIGAIYQQENNYKEALNYSLKSLDLEMKMGDKEDYLGTLRTVTEIEVDVKNYAKAIEYGNQALKLAQDAGIQSNVMEDSKLLYEAYKAQKDWKNGLAMHELYTNTYDTINDQTKHKEAVQKELQFEYDKKESDLRAAQDKKDAVAELDGKRKNIAILLAVIIAIATGVIAVIVFRSLRIARKQKMIIEEQKVLVEQKNKDILDSIAYAKRLQDAILPPLDMIKQYLPESFVLYKPKDIVAGDFYWMQQQGDKILIAACDCTGHGVPGAMVSVVCSNALYRAVKEFNIIEPGKILNKVRELVIETFQKSGHEVRDGMDVSLCVLTPSQDAKQGTTIQWAGANNPLWYMQGEEMKEIIPDKQPIGDQDGAKDFTTHTLVLNKGDNLYLFSDGFADQFGGPKGKKFKSRPFRELIKTVAIKGMEQQRNMLENAFESWKEGFEQTDDVCVIGIRL